MAEDNRGLKELIEELDLADEIELSDIPDIELYMEQLLTFFDKKLGHLKRDTNDKIFTKTMVNNYTKDGLLPPPQNKKYGKEHIILLILIYNLKNILSFNDISSLFAPILKNIEQSDDDIVSLEDIYSALVNLKQYEFADFRQTLTEKFKLISDKTLSIENESEKELAQLFLTVIMLIAQANAAKRMAEQIIDKYF